MVFSPGFSWPSACALDFLPIEVQFIFSLLPPCAHKLAAQQAAQAAAQPAASFYFPFAFLKSREARSVPVPMLRAGADGSEWLSSIMAQ